MRRCQPSPAAINIVITHSKAHYYAALNYVTHSFPEQEMHTNEPMVVLTYVGPLWLQSKQFLLDGKARNSLNVLRFFSSCFFFELLEVELLAIAAIDKNIMQSRRDDDMTSR